MTKFRIYMAKNKKISKTNTILEGDTLQDAINKDLIGQLEYVKDINKYRDHLLLGVVV